MLYWATKGFAVAFTPVSNDVKLEVAHPPEISRSMPINEQRTTREVVKIWDTLLSKCEAHLYFAYRTRMSSLCFGQWTL